MKLNSGDIIFVDTAPFIYFFEDHPQYFPFMKRFFDQVYNVSAQVITSMITYIEITTQPTKYGNESILLKYRDYLTHSENISLFPIDLKIADQSVKIRAEYGFKTPDAIQLGTAVACGSDYIITNDQAWKKFDAIPVHLVDEL